MQGQTETPDKLQLEEAVRFSLTTLLAVTDTIQAAEPHKTVAVAERAADSLLEPGYSRPWWAFVFGLGGIYLGYLLFWRTSGRKF
ncbi:MAG: hypothetical protein M0Z55_00495 [Peptococcaceae bacterium]|nr:hypothetical protein [Peptococcaceae bacterium]